MKRLQVLLDKEAYDDIFQMEELRTLGPQEWGVAGIEMLLKAVAGFLGMNQENIILNAFHKVLIENEKPADLKVYKDDGQLLEMGAKSAIIPMPVNDYKKIFSNVQMVNKTLIVIGMQSSSDFGQLRVILLFI